jgi:hypothetical protein
MQSMKIVPTFDEGKYSLARLRKIDLGILNG